MKLSKTELISPVNTILVLEDEKSLQSAIKSKLTTVGFSVVAVNSVNGALEYLNHGGEVDGFWVDHYLSGKKTGLDFVTSIKKNQKWKKLPIFVVSNTVSQEKLQIYLKLGVMKCYVKVDYRLDTITDDIKRQLIRTGAKKP